MPKFTFVFDAAIVVELEAPDIDKGLEQAQQLASELEDPLRQVIEAQSFTLGTGVDITVDPYNWELEIDEEEDSG